MINHVTLESVAAAFGRWRQARRSRREPVPAHLQQQAVELLSHYKQIQVLQTLKINHAMLKRWRQESHSPVSMEFVSLPEEGEHGPSSSAVQVTLSSCRGAQMTITGSVSGEQLAVLVQSFVAEARQ